MDVETDRELGRVKKLLQGRGQRVENKRREGEGEKKYLSFLLPASPTLVFFFWLSRSWPGSCEQCNDPSLKTAVTNSVKLAAHVLV